MSHTSLLPGPSLENEYKFTSDSADPAQCIGKLRFFLESSGMPFDESERSYTDRYYDSSGRGITSTGGFLRQRTYSDGRGKLTVKRPVSTDGKMVREEIERTTDCSFDDLREFSNKYFPGVDIDSIPTLVNVCRRTVFAYRDGSGIKLSFDMCQYVVNDTRKDYAEIELECISDHSLEDFDGIGVSHFVTEELHFSPVQESKYVRGLRWMEDL